jgi:uncharacterized protein (TIGR04255 family)
MATRYRKTPLSEAIFEFAPLDATLTTDGVEHLKSAFSDEYPKAEELPGMEVEVEFGPAGVSAKHGGKKTVRYRLWNQARSRLVQVAQDMCAFNALPPYSHYIDYLPDIEKLFAEYSRTCRPAGIRLLGHRYINRIFLPSEDVDPTDYFAFYPPLRGRRHPPFLLRFETEPLPRGGQVTLSLYYASLDNQKPVYFLDLYAQAAQNLNYAFDWTLAKAWQDEAHDAVTRAFELAITDRCRELLGREE